MADIAVEVVESGSGATTVEWVPEGAVRPAPASLALEGLPHLRRDLRAAWEHALAPALSSIRQRLGSSALDDARWAALPAVVDRFVLAGLESAVTPPQLADYVAALPAWGPSATVRLAAAQIGVTATAVQMQLAEAVEACGGGAGLPHAEVGAALAQCAAERHIDALAAAAVEIDVRAVAYLAAEGDVRALAVLEWWRDNVPAAAKTAAIQAVCERPPPMEDSASLWAHLCSTTWAQSRGPRLVSLSDLLARGEAVPPWGPPRGVRLNFGDLPAAAPAVTSRLLAASVERGLARWARQHPVAVAAGGLDQHARAAEAAAAAAAAAALAYAQGRAAPQIEGRLVVRGARAGERLRLAPADGSQVWWCNSNLAHVRADGTFVVGREHSGSAVLRWTDRATGVASRTAVEIEIEVEIGAADL